MDGSGTHADQAIDQPDALFNPATRMFDAGNWQVTDSWNVPDDAVSGVYIAKLVREDGIAGENSTAAAPDLIVSFRTGRDQIDLRGIAIEDGHFIGGHSFSGVAGEFRFDRAQHLLEGDLDGDGVADFAIKFGAGHVTTHDLLF